MTEMMLALNAVLLKQEAQSHEDGIFLAEILREVLTDPEIAAADTAYVVTKREAYAHMKRALYRPRRVTPEFRPHHKGDGRFVQSVMSYLQGATQ